MLVSILYMYEVFFLYLDRDMVIISSLINSEWKVPPMLDFFLLSNRWKGGKKTSHVQKYMLMSVWQVYMYLVVLFNTVSYMM
jgi:hypothetical protein